MSCTLKINHNKTVIQPPDFHGDYLLQSPCESTGFAGLLIVMKKCRNSYGTEGSGRELPEHLAWKILEMWTAIIRHLLFGCLAVLCLKVRIILVLAGVRPPDGRLHSHFPEIWQFYKLDVRGK